MSLRQPQPVRQAIASLTPLQIVAPMSWLCATGSGSAASVCPRSVALPPMLCRPRMAVVGHRPFSCM